PVEDIRSGRPYILSRRPLGGLARRILSVAALIAIDVAGVNLGVCAVAIARGVARGVGPPLWGLIWRTAEDWLPFLTVVTVLVFWVGGLYRRREVRTGFGQVIKSLVLVALITLAFGIGTGYHFTTYALTPTALVLTALVIGVLRASYDVVTRDVFRLAGVRRRAVLVGEGERLAQLLGTLGSARNGIDYEFLGAISPNADEPGLPGLGSLDAVPRVLAERHVDELIITDTAFSERQLLDLVEEAHRRRVSVRVAPTATELLFQRAEYVPGQGVPLFELRPPALAGTDWVVKRGFDLAVSSLVIAAGLPVWLVVAAAIKVTSKGPVFFRDHRIGLGEREFGMVKFRTMYADAQARQAALEAENEASGPLFKIKDDPRVTPAGRFLRPFSIHDLPQVLNVLSGELSLV